MENENTHEYQLIQIKDNIIHYMITDGNEGTVPLPEGELGEAIASLFSGGEDILILIEITNGQQNVTDFRCPSTRRNHGCGIL